jgi:hypothetical protein
MPGEHAKLSASSAHRWLTCTAAPTLEEQLPDTTSEYAVAGTVAHALAESAARQRIFEPDTIFNPGDDLEMMNAAIDYADLIYTRYAEAKTRCPDPLVVLEQRVDFSKWVPKGFGTADCLIIADGVLEVVDFKYGAGVPVAAEDNPQMMLYALGAGQEFGLFYDIETVRMTIFQPRCSAEPSTAEISARSLLLWAERTLRPAAAIAFTGPGEFSPGEHQCRFCRAAAQCRARANQFLALFDDADDMQEKVERLNTTNKLLDPAEAAAILTRAKGFKDFLSVMEVYVLACACNGDDTPGWKVVTGRSVRTITDSNVAAQKLIAAGYSESLVWQRKLETLANLEKLVKPKKLKDVLGDLIVKPEGAPTLVPESDKREPIKPDEQLLAAFDQ